ncbi:MAG: hypothetical protein HYV13_00775 [Candidatus Doudnabacteria bacterium]|nr:hypothetical protein [Candidatus Doudnabacteria bacterium]
MMSAKIAHVIFTRLNAYAARHDLTLPELPNVVRDLADGVEEVIAEEAQARPAGDAAMGLASDEHRG